MRPTENDSVVGLLPALRAIARQLGARNGRVVERRDLVQDGSLAALRALQRWNGTDPFRTFVHTRMRGGMIDALRRWSHFNRRQKAVVIDFVPIGRRDFQSLSTCPDRAYQRQELHEKLSLLSDNDRRLLCRYYLDGETQATIATATNQSESNVSLQCQRALGRLRAHYQSWH